jgi:hypothetical protein
VVEVLCPETLNRHLENEVAVELLDQEGMRQLLFDELIQSPSDVNIVKTVTFHSLLLVINELIIFRVLLVFLFVRGRRKALALLLLQFLFSK